LPRQELTMGKNVWIIHGVMWTLFHFFWWWNLIALLPVCLGISYVAYKTKSSWPGLIAHMIYNGIGIFVVAFVVASII
jgi:membrane protease YdiL (CAAX protease family)